MQKDTGLDKKSLVAETATECKFDSCLTHFCAITLFKPLQWLKVYRISALSYTIFHMNYNNNINKNCVCISVIVTVTEC